MIAALGSAFRTIRNLAEAALGPYVWVVLAYLYVCTLNKFNSEYTRNVNGW
jgi:hypothetical protein